MGYRTKTIGATKGGLGSAECSAEAEKSLLTGPKTAKMLEETLEKRSINARETLEKRSRYRPVLRLDVINQQ
jgi:hypothetical protein